MSRSRTGSVKRVSGHDRSPETPVVSGEQVARFQSVLTFSYDMGRRSGYGTSFRSLFGEPLPTLVSTPDVAPATSAEATWAGVAEVWPAR